MNNNCDCGRCPTCAVGEWDEGMKDVPETRGTCATHGDYRSSVCLPCQAEGLKEMKERLTPKPKKQKSDPTDKWSVSPDAWRSPDLETRIARFCRDVGEASVGSDAADWYVEGFIKTAISNYHQRAFRTHQAGKKEAKCANRCCADDVKVD